MSAFSQSGLGQARGFSTEASPSRAPASLKHVSANLHGEARILAEEKLLMARDKTDDLEQPPLPMGSTLRLKYRESASQINEGNFLGQPRLGQRKQSRF